ncbi:MAG: Uncharacterised protein [Flavobacteriia bacterium]|nr:MAG: Uncharacterised protein [Flavobacteriia bacterium]
MHAKISIGRTENSCFDGLDRLIGPYIPRAHFHGIAFLHKVACQWIGAGRIDHRTVIDAVLTPTDPLGIDGDRLALIVLAQIPQPVDPVVGEIVHEHPIARHLSFYGRIDLSIGVAANDSVVFVFSIRDADLHVENIPGVHLAGIRRHPVGVVAIAHELFDLNGHSFPIDHSRVKKSLIQLWAHRPQILLPIPELSALKDEHGCAVGVVVDAVQAARTHDLHHASVGTVLARDQ